MSKSKPTGNTYTITVPPQAEPLPARGDVLEPLSMLLHDAAETLHGYYGTDWMAERCTEHERDYMLLAARYVTGMMFGLGLWERDDPPTGAS